MEEFITYGHSNWGSGTCILSPSRLTSKFRLDGTKRSKSCINLFFIMFSNHFEERRHFGRVDRPECFGLNAKAWTFTTL